MYVSKHSKMFLSLLLAAVFSFSLSIEASAHEYIDLEGNSYTHDENINVSASAVEIGDEAAMKKFTLHVAAHMNLFETQNVDTAREVTVFLRRARQARRPDGDGVLSHGDIYPISVNSRGIIVSHVLYPELWGSSYDSSEDPLKTLLGPSVPRFAEDVSPECAYYRLDGEDGERVACAVTGTIVGFHHALEDRVVRSPDCSGYNLEITAERVEKETDPEEKRKLLKDYVKGVLERFSELVSTLVAEAVVEGIDLATPEGI